MPFGAEPLRLPAKFWFENPCAALLRRYRCWRHQRASHAAASNAFCLPPVFLSSSVNCDHDYRLYRKHCPLLLPIRCPACCCNSYDAGEKRNAMMLIALLCRRLKRSLWRFVSASESTLESTAPKRDQGREKTQPCMKCQGFLPECHRNDCRRHRCHYHWSSQRSRVH